VGGGKDVALSTSGKGNAKAGITTLSGGTIAGLLTAAKRANVETWREVR
jgi:hypothetical protein